MKTVLYRQNEFEAHKTRIGEAAQKFNTLLQESNRLGLIKIQNLEDFKRLVMEGEVFVREKISEQIPTESLSLGLFKIKRKNAVDLLELPDFQTLNELAKDCSPSLSLLQYCQLKSEKIIVDPVRLEQLRSAYTTTTKNSGEERLLSCYEALVKASSEFSKASVDLNCAPLYQDNVIGKFLNVLADGTVTRSEQFLVEAWGDLERKAEQARQTA